LHILRNGSTRINRMSGTGEADRSKSEQYFANGTLPRHSHVTEDIEIFQ
jgi:hypothetical protein